MWNAKITVAVGAASAPLASTGAPPGHLASRTSRAASRRFATGGVGGPGADRRAVREHHGALALGGRHAVRCSRRAASLRASRPTPRRTRCSTSWSTAARVNRRTGVMNPSQPDQRLSSVTFTPRAGLDDAPLPPKREQRHHARHRHVQGLELVTEDRPRRHVPSGSGLLERLHLPDRPRDHQAVGAGATRQEQTSVAALGSQM